MLVEKERIPAEDLDDQTCRPLGYGGSSTPLEAIPEYESPLLMGFFCLGLPHQGDGFHIHGEIDVVSCLSS